jgi:NADH-quinone oxidoreductase subunit C
MEILKQKLLSDFDGLDIQIPNDKRIIISTAKEAILSLLSYLKNDGYEHLAMISCNDWIEAGKLELVYILSAYMADDTHYQKKEAKSIIIKTNISRNTAKFITITNLFNSAEPYEREMHEMFGIVFEGHPRLTPLMLEREYKIPPFRKDFDTLAYVDNTFGKIPSIQQRKEGLQ